MARSTHDDERQRSHSMAFTTAIQGHHPPMTPRNTFVMDTDRFQSHAYIRNETGNSGLCYSPAPYSYMDSLSTPLTSVQRDYTPRVIDISYTEGSGDKKWSSTDFPWTKELEVIFFLQNQQLITRIIIGLRQPLIFTASSGQQQESVWKPLFPPKSARNNQCHNEWE